MMAVEKAAAMGGREAVRWAPPTVAQQERPKVVERADAMVDGSAES